MRARGAFFALAACACAAAAVAAADNGVTVDTAARRVTFRAKTTGVRPEDAVEFFAIGPLSDRAYEAFCVTEASPADIAAGLEKIGVPRGVPPNLAEARLWPAGERVVLTARETATGKTYTFAELMADKQAADGEDAAQVPLLYTGGAREASGALAAATNMPCAVFALYTHAPSPLLMDGQFDQSSNYGRFRARKEWPKDTVFEISLAWDGQRRLALRDVTLTRADAAETLGKLRAEAETRNLFVRLAFGADVTVADARGIAEALACVDGQGLKMNGPQPGHFFFRAFLPEETWRERAGRLGQPFEIHVRADGSKVFTFIEEDWSGDGLDPVLKPRETPFKDWAELPALVAATGTQGAKNFVVFIFAPKDMKVSDLAPVLPVLTPRITTWYIFGG